MGSADEASERRHLGGGFYLTTLPPGSAYQLRIDSGVPHPSWRARRPATQLRAAFPGSAILMGERWYEVVRIEPSPGYPTPNFYFLRSWDETAPMRTTYELTRASCEAVAAEHRRSREREQLRRVLAPVPFLTGLLPAEDQRRLERRLDLRAVRSTAISAATLLFLSVLALAAVFASSQGHHFGSLQGLVDGLAQSWLLLVYFVLESYARLWSASKSNEPMGSLPVAFPILALRRLGKALSTPERQRAAVERVYRTGHETFARALDEVRPLDGTRGDLEVTSLLPKDHWAANVTGIRYGGELYFLVEREVLQSRDGVRHRFVLQKPRHEVLFQSVCDYWPDEVQEIYRARRRLDASTWVGTFGLLWGLLDRDTQLRLHHVYGHDALQWTVFSTVAVAAVSAVALAEAVSNLNLGVADFADVVQLFGAGALLWESALRWRTTRGGEIRGSVLGALLKPIAVRFLRWE